MYIRFFLVSALILALPSPAFAQDEAGSSTLSLFPVEYQAEGEQTEPSIAPHMAEIEKSLNRAWSGKVLINSSLSESMKSLWVLPYDPSRGDDVLQRANKAEKIFREDSSAEAIRVLEGLITEADKLLPDVSDNPEASKALLKAHLYLWWSLKDVGSSAGRLDALMSATAARFPAVTVDTMDVPPFVAQAFEGHKERQRRENSSNVSIYLNGLEGETCQILINGTPHGDSRRAGIAVPPGRTYYVTGQCGETSLPTRRVVVGEEPQEIKLDMAMAQSLVQTSAGPTLLLPVGAEQVSAISTLGSSVGDALQSGDVVLAGVHMGEAGPEVQFDRIHVQDGVRTCSVRIDLDQISQPGVLDEAIRAVVANRPTKTAILFAGEDGIYRTPEEHVEFSTRDGIQRPITWVSLGASALALSGALAFEIIIQGQQDDLDKCITKTSCRGTSKANDARDKLKTSDTSRGILYGTSAALALGAAVFYFVEAPNPEDYLASRKTRLLPWIGQDTAGASLQWSWD